MHPLDRIEIINRLATPLAASLGLEIWGVEITGSSRPLVRVYVDVPGLSSSIEEPVEDTGETVAGHAARTAAESAADTAAGPGVSIDQCAELSRLLGLSLDVEDIFASGWTLEVSSPGLERPFFHLDQMCPYLGREIEATLSAPLDTWPGRKKFCGILQQIENGCFTLDLPLIPVARRRADEPASVSIPWSGVRKASLVHVFPEPGAKKGGTRN